MSKKFKLKFLTDLKGEECKVPLLEMKIKSLKGKEKQTIFYLDLLNINFMVSTLYTLK